MGYEDVQGGHHGMWNVTSLAGLREHLEETIGFRLQIWRVSCRYSMKPNPMIWWNQPQTADSCDSCLKRSLWPTFCGLFLHDLAWKMTTFTAQRTDLPDIAAVSHLHNPRPTCTKTDAFPILAMPQPIVNHRSFFCKCLIHFLTNRSRAYNMLLLLCSFSLTMTSWKHVHQSACLSCSKICSKIHAAIAFPTELRARHSSGDSQPNGKHLAPVLPWIFQGPTGCAHWLCKWDKIWINGFVWK